MTNYDDLGSRIIHLMSVVNIFGLSGNKLAHELHGMEMAMQAMHIEFEPEYNADVTQYTGITIMGKRYAIAE